MLSRQELSIVGTERGATDHLPASLNANAAPSPQQQDRSAQQNKLESISKTRPKILLVDDNGDDIFLTRKALERKNCEVVLATSVTEAFRQIAAQRFDVLITDLHMPDAGDGFAVVTAMRHTQPEALTLVVSGYPDVPKAMAAITMQADKVLVKPFDVEQLSGLISHRMLTSKPCSERDKEGVASILDRDAAITIQRWLTRVEEVPELTSIPLTAKDRTAYLPEIIRSLTVRLRGDRTIDVSDSPCAAAVMHGQLRCRQGYTAPLVVQESRILQVCIFETIKRNLGTVDFTSVLPDIMIIADEVDAQLKQTIDSFLNTERGLAATTS
jgi:CheY-like chemotaxis protein